MQHFCVSIPSVDSGCVGPQINQMELALDIFTST